MKKVCHLPNLAQTRSESAILKLVRDQSPISRTRVAELSGFPLSAVSNLVDALLTKNVLIEERLADATGARRKRGLTLNAELGHCVSVQYSISAVYGSIIDSSYRILGQCEMHADVKRMTRQQRLELIIDFIKSLRAKAPASQCLAISVVDPGAVNDKTGIISLCSILDDWNNVALKQIITDAFKMPVLLISNCCNWFGAVLL